ncbi:MAG: MFS transporter [Defluviitaleaceae bacterium]|nr:MFS transporter [Defluviitaleaceae bacterium]
MFNLFSKNRNFRNFTLFSAFGGIGRGMFAMFMMWAIHAMYQNPIYTGLAGFMFGAPLVISFVVGPFVDRWNKVRVLRVVEFVKLCAAGLILLAHLYLEVGVWFYLTVILAASIASLFGTPAGTALLPRIVDGDDIVKANALMNMFGIFGGLAIGVVLYRLMQQGADFALVYGVNTAVFVLAVIFSLTLKSGEDKDEKAPSKTYFGDLKSGFAFVKKGVMLPVVFFVTGMTLFSQMTYVNLPMFAQLHLGSASGYILLSALALLGGLVGSWIVGLLASKVDMGRILIIAFVLAGVTRILFVNIIGDNLTRAILIYILYVGLGSAIGILHRALVQKLPPKELISRVDTSIISLSALAGAAGSIVGGFLGTHLANIDYVFIIQGASYIAIGVLLMVSKNIRGLPKITELSKSDE